MAGRRHFTHGYIYLVPYLLTYLSTRFTRMCSTLCSSIKRRHRLAPRFPSASDREMARSGLEPDLPRQIRRLRRAACHPDCHLGPRAESEFGENVLDVAF